MSSPTPTPVDIDPDLHRAHALPPSVYHQPRWFERITERVLRRTWHGLADPPPASQPGSVQPWNLLPGSLDEALVITHDDTGPHLLSNACTRCRTLLVTRAGRAEALPCPGGDRRYALDGRRTDADGDALVAVPWAHWGGLPFASLDPSHPFDALLEDLPLPLRSRPWDERTTVPALCRDYDVATSWLQYCEHMLDPGLGFEPQQPWPTIELLRHGAVIDRSKVAADADAPAPPGRPAASTTVWLFPCTIVDIHPWGTSTRLLLPLAPQRTRIVVIGQRWDGSAVEAEAPRTLDTVEHHAQGLLTLAAAGVRSRLARRRTYDAARDRGVHHFHRQLAALLDT
ncbi:MAG: hypothetical protein K0V04_33885 [Deltaproteobacteria bacterium]|nr:hypothetical protein [Deltaproteobacteria bacterium]